MPAKELTPQQKADASRLKSAFKIWQAAEKSAKRPSSQEEAALRMGFGQSALSQYLNGTIPLNAEVLWKFSRLLGCNPQEISPTLFSAEADRSAKWASAAEAIAADVLGEVAADHGAIARALRREDAQLVPPWLRHAFGEDQIFIPDFVMQFTDGSLLFVEVKADLLAGRYPTLAKIAAERPAEFLLVPATLDRAGVYDHVNTWMEERARLLLRTQSLPEHGMIAESSNFTVREHHRPFYATEKSRVWVVAPGEGGMSDRVWDEGASRPNGATGEFAEVATNDPRAFVWRVQDDEMAPRYMLGEYALVEPSVEPELEDDVLVLLSNGSVLLRRLVSRRGGIRLGSHVSSSVQMFREGEIAWMYYVAHPLPARRIRQRLE